MLASLATIHSEQYYKNIKLSDETSVIMEEDCVHVWTYEWVQILFSQNSDIKLIFKSQNSK